MFASVSLPVSVNTEGTYLNQIYIGMFRPDADGFPRWVGNLKQYKLGSRNGRLQTQDADSVSAVNNSTGFITECARSFWTPTTADTYWAFSPQGMALSPIAAPRCFQELELPGRQHRREGRAGLQIACADGRTHSVQDRRSMRILRLAGRFRQHERHAGRARCRQRDRARQLINWARGWTSTMRQDKQWQRGRATGRAPALVPRRRRALAPGGHQHGHGRTIARGRGVLWRQRRRAARRQRQPRRTAPADRRRRRRREMWAFMAPEFFRHQAAAREQIRSITSATHFAAPEPKPYGFDGPIIAHRTSSTRSCEDLLWLYASMRRGGRTIYAFDVSDDPYRPTSPDAQVAGGCSDGNTGCTRLRGDRPDLEHTQVLRASGYNDGGSPAVPQRRCCS